MRCFLLLAIVFWAPTAFAGPLAPLQGWAVYPTNKSFKALVKSTRKAVKASGLGIVTQAGPTKAAAARGITIPGNLVIGIFNNDFAVRVLRLSTAAMIEAPIRIYLTENEDKTATLSYKKPSFIYAPYLKEGGDTLAGIAYDLDRRFSEIAKRAVSQ